MSLASARDHRWGGILRYNGFLIMVCPQEGVHISRWELRDVNWLVRRYPNAQLVATHYQTPIQGPPYPEKELIEGGKECKRRRGWAVRSVLRGSKLKVDVKNKQKRSSNARPKTQKNRLSHCNAHSSALSLKFTTRKPP